MKITRDYFAVFKGNIEPKHFLSFSDIHYCYWQQLFYQRFMKDYFQQMMQNEKNIDSIFVPGDLLLYLSKYPNPHFIQALKDDLNRLVYHFSAPLFVSFGNHDFPVLHTEYLDEKKWNLKYFLDNRGNGLYVLDNEQVLVGDMMVTGFSPKRDAYNTTYMPKKALEMAYQEFQACQFHFDSQYFHVLLSHENKFFTYPEVASRYPNLYEPLTLILGGHLHDGYLPIVLQKMFPNIIKDLGFFETYPFKIDMCRGLFRVSNNDTSEVIFPTTLGNPVTLHHHEAASIVNRGVAKYSWVLLGRPSYTIIDVGPNPVKEEAIVRKRVI